jgi:hypothetical protein
MTNRIGSYSSDDWNDDLQRAQETVAFCSALLRIWKPGEFASWELDLITTMQVVAASVFRRYGLPVPWLASNKG